VDLAISEILFDILTTMFRVVVLLEAMISGKQLLIYGTNDRSRIFAYLLASMMPVNITISAAP